MKLYKLLPLIILCGIFILTGCGGDEVTAPAEPTDAPGWIARGWAQFKNSDYEDAVDSFQSAINLGEGDWADAYSDWLYAIQIGDPELQAEAEARMDLQMGYIKEGATGIGWCITKDLYITTWLNPSIGTLAYEGALDIDYGYADAIGGYALLLQAIEEWQQSNTRAAALLGGDDSLWVFPHDRTIDHLDIRLVRAENYYMLADFEASQMEALGLATRLGYQPEDLVPDFNYNLATIEGRAALIQLIDELEEHL